MKHRIEVGAGFRRWCRGLVAAVLSVAVGAALAAPDGDPVAALKLQVAPTPKWVAPVAPASKEEVPAAALHYAVRDFQTKVDANEVERYAHVVRVLNQVAGLENGAQIEVEFDPSYQTLAFHELAVVRGGRRIDKLDPKRVKFLQRETQLERRMYDGRVTASIVLDDVRVGDRVEWAYTVRGDNPVFKHKFADITWSVASLGPAVLFQYRLIAPAQRAIRVRAGGPDFVQTERTVNGQREVLVRRASAPQPQGDQYVPSSVYLDDVVQASEFADWQDVARWADQLFAVAQAPSAAVGAQAREIARHAKTPEERVQYALDFVQREIRYFGTEIGANTHQPANPETVLAQRFGDCKDKTVLLVALLKALDVPAEPTLVSTYMRNETNRQLESPLGFNHVIARVTLGDRVYWLDGTRSHQTGALAGRDSTGLELGLIARADQTGLTPMPSALNELRVVAQSTVNFKRYVEDPTLDTSLTYYGEYAEYMRNALATNPIEEVEKDFVGDFARAYNNNVAQIGGLQVQELDNQNAVKLSMRFRLPDFLRFEKKLLTFDLPMMTLMQGLRVPNQAPRTLPLRIYNQGIYRETIDVAFPDEAFLKPFSNRFDERNTHFEVHEKLGGEADTAHFTGELRMLTTQIPAADWQPHLQRVQKTFTQLSGNVVFPAVTARQVEQIRAELAQLDRDYDNGKLKNHTEVQVRALAEVPVQTAQLDGGRLAPKLRAKLLIDRGVNLDFLGRVESARLDFEESIRIDPRNPDTHNALAVNALMREQDDLALREASTALKLAPDSHEPRYLRSYANFFRKDYEAARSDLVDVLKDPNQVERSYAGLWLYLAVRRTGQDGVAAVQPYMPRGVEPEWPYPVLQWLTDAISFDQALAATKNRGRDDRNKLCELYFYAAQKHLADGNVAKAREFFQRSLDTGVTEYNEYTFSRRELAQLKAR